LFLTPHVHLFAMEKPLSIMNNLDAPSISLLVGEALGPLQVAGIAPVLISVWFNGRRSDPREMAPTG
jgi:drug/metabolite transporter (DMT)-like permease